MPFITTDMISIVTPSYNQGKFLAETIESVIGQVGDFYLDFIIIDGGSTDGSVEIIEYYEKILNNGAWEIKCKDIRYRWVSEQDQGQADAIMKGFAMAEGEILAWLNSDDLYLPGALGSVMQFFSEDPSNTVVYGKTHFTDEAGNIIGKYPTIAFDKGLLPSFNFICQPSTFFKKSAMKDVGGLDLNLHYVMDYDFWIRLSEKYGFHYIDNFMSTYRLHDNSKTISDEKALENHTETLKTVINYYGYAPLNRVYVYCYHKMKVKYPNFNIKMIVFFSLVVTFFKYLILNRGIRIYDLKMITRKNFRKISMDLIDIYKEY